MSTNRTKPHGTLAADPAPFRPAGPDAIFAFLTSTRMPGDSPRFHGERMRYLSGLEGVGAWIAEMAVMPALTAATTTEPAVSLNMPVTTGSRVGIETIVPATSPAWTTTTSPTAAIRPA